MKKLLAVAMVLLMGLPALINAVAVSDYLIRYEVYDQELCENKDAPELQCHGTCQLMQKLAAPQEGPEAPALPALTESLDFPALLHEHQIALFTPSFFPATPRFYRAPYAPSPYLKGDVNPPEFIA